MQRLAREFTPRATEILREIANDPNEDSRNRIVAIGMLYDRAWGKPKDYDPADEPKPKRDRFDASKYTVEELEFIGEALTLIVARAVSRFYRAARPRPGLMLGFSGFPRQSIVPSAARLAALVVGTAERKRSTEED
jgi:hypothetical protein